MSFTRKGKISVPLAVQTIGHYELACYKGKISRFDILIRYRQQKMDGSWSLIRTPKHIHWTVDVLSKKFTNKRDTKKFVKWLRTLWIKTPSVGSGGELKKELLKRMKPPKDAFIKAYASLEGKGEYSLAFLVVLAKLLMLQEKANRKDAYMFDRLLQSIEEDQDIFSVVGRATHNRR